MADDAIFGAANTASDAVHSWRSRSRANQSCVPRKHSCASLAAVNFRPRWSSTGRCARSTGAVSASSARLSATTTLRRFRWDSEPHRRPRERAGTGGVSSSVVRCESGVRSENSIWSQRTEDDASIVATPSALKRCSSITEIHPQRNLASESSAEVSLGSSKKPRNAISCARTVIESVTPVMLEPRAIGWSNCAVRRNFGRSRASADCAEHVTLPTCPPRWSSITWTQARRNLQSPLTASTEVGRKSKRNLRAA